MAKNLGEKFNSSRIDYCPFVDNQTQTLFFTSERSRIETNISNNKNLDELLNYMNKYENGLSRIYIISLTDILQ